MRGPPSGYSRYLGDKGSRRQSLAGQARLAEAGRGSKATRPACGRGWWMEASATEPAGSSPMNRMTGADGRAAWAALGTSPAPRPPVRLLGWGQGCCWPLAGVRLCSMNHWLVPGACRPQRSLPEDQLIHLE